MVREFIFFVKNMIIKSILDYTKELGLILDLVRGLFTFQSILDTKVFTNPNFIAQIRKRCEQMSCTPILATGCFCVKGEGGTKQIS